MKLKKIKDVLESTELPVAYDAFPVDEAPELPFIVYREIGTDNFGADNKVWAVFLRIRVDLLVERRNSIIESKIEKAFDDNDIFWERQPVFESDEHYTRITYEIEV